MTEERSIKDGKKGRWRNSAITRALPNTRFGVGVERRKREEKKEEMK
jgi:hypothetical protein